MNTVELTYCVRSDPRLNNGLCLGVFPVDKLPKPDAYPCCLIQNLDTSKQEGSHWTATYIDHDGYGFYFDSYGKCPTKPVEAYLTRHCDDFAHNGKMVQGVYSSCCGQHCLYFLSRKAAGESLEEIIDSYDDEDLFENDKIVTDFVNETYDLKTVTVEPDYVLRQICKSLE
jgi:hypothetical protein